MSDPFWIRQRKNTGQEQTDKKQERKISHHFSCCEAEWEKPQQSVRLTVQPGYSTGNQRLELIFLAGTAFFPYFSVKKNRRMLAEPSRPSGRKF